MLAIASHLWHVYCEIYIQNKLNISPVISLGHLHDYSVLLERNSGIGLDNMRMSIYLSIHLCVHPSVCLSICLSIHLSVQCDYSEMACRNVVIFFKLLNIKYDLSMMHVFSKCRYHQSTILYIITAQKTYFALALEKYRR